ncbi:unnamed protein product [Caenorhabditis brenneri]
MEPIPPKKRKFEENNLLAPIPQVQLMDIPFTPIPPLPSQSAPNQSAGSSSSSSIDALTTTIPQSVTGQMDSKLRELLLSSPAHLFGHHPQQPTAAASSSSSSHQNGLNNTTTPQAAVTSWENWLCVLATNLSPAQWQGYWLAHCALFGEQAVPIHMLSFFQGQFSPSSSSSPSSMPLLGPHPNDPIHERYGTPNFF